MVRAGVKVMLSKLNSGIVDVAWNIPTSCSPAAVFAGFIIIISPPPPAARRGDATPYAAPPPTSAAGWMADDGGCSPPGPVGWTPAPYILAPGPGKQRGAGGGQAPADGKSPSVDEAPVGACGTGYGGGKYGGWKSATIAVPGP